VWSATPEAKPEFCHPAGTGGGSARRRRGPPHHFQARSGPYSSSFIHSESWLDFDSMQDWRDVS